MDLILSRNSGKITLPVNKPNIAPEQLTININKILAKDLRNICSSWKIKFTGKPTVSEFKKLILDSFEKTVQQQTNLKKYRLGELFAGTGGFSHAFESTEVVSPVFANDNEISCKPLFDANFPGTELTIADINEYDISKIPDIDILTFGSPCQSFSIAGEQKGFDDPRGNVFWRIIDILKLKKPKAFIMENVKNLTTHDSGKTFKTMIDNFEQIGYHCSNSVLNTCRHTNIPQNRERIFVVGFLNSVQSLNFQFPPITENMIELRNFLEITGVDESFYYNDSLKVWPLIQEQITKSIETNTIYQYRRTIVRENMNNVCPTLTANMGSGGHNVPLLKDLKGIRKLTPRECFKLQGFPETLIIPPKISNSALYKMAGNAITVSLVEKLATEMIRVLETYTESDTTKFSDSELSKSEVYELYQIYKRYCNDKNKIYLRHKKIARLPNFPEDVSENIVRQYIIQKENINCIWNTKVGDLEKIFENSQKKIEVKCFASTGPTSFGPNETWDELYFLDATEFNENKIKIYKIPLASDSEKFQKIQINKIQTYENQCTEKRRPRLCFAQIQSQLNDSDCELVFNGHIEDLLV